MTGRTHDLAAFTALSLIIAYEPLHNISLATALVAFSSNMIGGLAPDIDQSTAALWHRLPAGSVFGHLLAPLFGGHRYISHSIVGIVLFGFGFSYLLNAAQNVLIIDRDIVWWAFMIGFISHLIMDTLTHEGVPWFFPIPWKIGFPPFRTFRIKTGGLIEKSIVFPGLLILCGYLYYLNYNKFLDFIKHYVK